MIRVLVVDDHPLVRQGLRSLVDQADGVEVVEEAADGERGVAAAALHPSTAMARRFLEKHVPAHVLADAAAGERDEEVAPIGPPTVEQPASPGAPGAPSGAVGPGA